MRYIPDAIMPARRFANPNFALVPRKLPVFRWGPKGVSGACGCLPRPVTTRLGTRMPKSRSINVY